MKKLYTITTLLGAICVIAGIAMMMVSTSLSVLDIRTIAGVSDLDIQSMALSCLYISLSVMIVRFMITDHEVSE